MLWLFLLFWSLIWICVCSITFCTNVKIVYVIFLKSSHISCFHDTAKYETSLFVTYTLTNWKYLQSHYSRVWALPIIFWWALLITNNSTPEMSFFAKRNWRLGCCVNSGTNSRAICIRLMQRYLEPLAGCTSFVRISLCSLILHTCIYGLAQMT